ncbi:MAG: NAD(P)H-binding protein [Candidatus Marinimicrobia bacterium]|nr:NAD(P)H-binding protein [Candidatus Neomarinimicrobiota bacterium]
MAEKTALLVGATGLVGSHLLQQLLEGGYYSQVRVLVRRPLGVEHPRLDVQVVDFENLHKYSGLVQGDDVFSCLGTTRRKAGSDHAFRQVDFHYPYQVARLALLKGATQHLLVSSVGANRGSRSLYLRVKGELELAIGALPFKAVHHFRPSLLLGKRQEFRLLERLAVVTAPLFAPLMAGPLGPYRPIKAKAVAAAMIKIARKGRDGQHTYPSDQIRVLAELPM